MAEIHIRNLEVETVIAALEAAAKTPNSEGGNWAGESMESLSTHIMTTHHAYEKRELPRLAMLAEKVVNRHGPTKTELPVIAAALAQLDEELTQHLAKEEAALFPYIADLERARAVGAAKPHGCFGTVANPIAMMTQRTRRSRNFPG